ncbi:hypothetical protein BC829DRAFT_97607 [Chytridium lagenaria]|nr:hypothetical protein BC829DRAFT_97607 [Chytridium lagenaria]
MQGRITKVLNMKPQEILAMMKRQPGREMFEDRKEKAEKAMGEKETKLNRFLRSLSSEMNLNLTIYETVNATLSSFKKLKAKETGFDVSLSPSMSTRFNKKSATSRQTLNLKKKPSLLSARALITIKLILKGLRREWRLLRRRGNRMTRSQNVLRRHSMKYLVRLCRSRLNSISKNLPLKTKNKI